MATVVTMTPVAARKKLEAAQGKLDVARAKCAAAQEGVRLADAYVRECQRNVEAADAAVKAREGAKALAKAEQEAAKARVKAEKEMAKALANVDRKPRSPSKMSAADDSIVNELYTRYCAIRDALETLPYSEIRTRINEFANHSKPVVASVLKRLGYSADGSKAEIVQALLTSLERIKGSLDQASRI